MESEKCCKKCGQLKQLSDFYANTRKCKECTKQSVRANYAMNRDYYSEYERCRFQTPERKASLAEAQRRRRDKYPHKCKAWNAVSNAVRDGRLEKPKNCQGCGLEKKLQAHHDDYNKPLDVKWLCFICHRELEHGQVVTQRSYCDTVS